MTQLALYRAKFDFTNNKVIDYSRVPFDEVKKVVFGNLYAGLAKTGDLALQVYTVGCLSCLQ